MVSPIDNPERARVGGSHGGVLAREASISRAIERGDYFKRELRSGSVDAARDLNICIVRVTERTRDAYEGQTTVHDDLWRGNGFRKRHEEHGDVAVVHCEAQSAVHGGPVRSKERVDDERCGGIEYDGRSHRDCVEDEDLRRGIGDAQEDSELHWSLFHVHAAVAQ